MSAASSNQSQLDSSCKRDLTPGGSGPDAIAHLSGVTLLALLPIVAGAITLFGIGNLFNIMAAILSAILSEVVVRRLAKRTLQIRKGHTIVLAIVLALILPPGCSWHIVALGAALMVVAKEIFGGLGHYLWHPVLVARVILCHFFSEELMPDDWPVLKKTHLIWGSLDRTDSLPANVSWFHSDGMAELQAWAGVRPVEILSSIYHHPPVEGHSAAQTMLELIRDELPPATDCLFGTTGGGIGETCVVAILLGGIFLIYRGCIHWTLPVGAAIGALLTAAVLPIPNGVGVETAFWWPIRLYVTGQTSLPIGWIMVGYHLLAGELMFATFFVSSDRTSSPRSIMGHLWFGLGLGVLTVVLRFVGFVPGATYWAILIMNTFVPLINRITRARATAT